MYREGTQLSPGAIQRLESGSHDVHVSLLYRYAEVLGVKPFELLKF
ncbi:MAG: helix-turn-helix transcriptional regulator [Bdellovibrionales bacterium]|nr:helix-turn-helix transcriptional regulator [Bdellovibrionales bacterium]